MTNRFRRRALASALLASSAFTMPGVAHAQEYFAPAIPPIRETVDESGVDLSRGAFVGRQHSVSIGGQGTAGLGWSRTVTSTGDFRDSTAAIISVNGSVYTVSIGNGSESFTLTGTNYVSNEKTGATLTKSGNIFTFTTRGGTIYSFAPWRGFKKQYGGTHRVSTITFSTGERLSFNYLLIDGICVGKDWDPCSAMVDAERLETVKATNGYELDLDYLEDYPVELADTSDLMNIIKVTARNSSVDPASQSWPTLDLYQAQTFTDSLNRTTTYTYTGGAMTGVKRPGATSNSTTIAYSSGRVSQVVNEGVTTNYSYSDLSGIRTTTVSDAIAGNRLVKTDLTTMLVTSDTDELGKVTSYEYYPTSGLLKKVTAPELNTAEFEYDARGNRTKTTLNPKPGTVLSPIISQASYPASDATDTWRCVTGTPAVKCNKPVTTTDPKGNVTDYAYESTTGEPSTVTAPAPTNGGVRPETRYSYTSTLYAQYRNGSGVLANFATPVTRLTGVSACQTSATCAGTADEAKSTITYGTANVLPVSVSSGSGNGTLTATNAFTYDAVGNRLTADGPLAGANDTTRTRFDAGRQAIGIVGPDPDGGGALKHRASRMTYNLDGQVTKTERGTVVGQTDIDWANFASLEAVETGYDSNARAVTTKLTSGGTTHALTQTSYDTIGRTDCVATRMNTAAFGSLPISACTLGTQGSFGPDRISKLTYDAANQPTKVTAALGTTDAADEVTATYTDNGKVATVKDAENNLTTTEYDRFDRVAKTRFPLPTKGSNASSTTDYTQPTYDAASNVTSLRLRDGQSIGLTNDNLSRVTAKDLPGSEPDVSYSYDNLNRLTSANQTGNNLSFTYDALGRNLTQVGPQGTVASQWDLAGRRTKLTYPGSALYVDYDYLVAGDMTKIRENGATSGVGILATYSYDDLGRRTGVAFGNGVAQPFTFDAVSRLASLSNELSGTSNDFASTFAYNPASQITSNVRTGDAYAWTGHYNENKTGTPNGLNQLTQYGAKTLTHADAKGNVTAFGTKSFTYSSENLLLTGPNSATLAYDPAMRLYQLAGASSISRFAYDGFDRIAEHDGNNAVLRRYVHGPAMDEPIVWYEGTGTTDRRFLSSDERGSIISVTDSAGALLSINRYDEFGQPQAGNLGSFGYTGQAWLPEVGAWYYKARVQEPELGRFLQPDPIGYEGGMNLYAYVGNDPVNFIDPLGLMRQECRAELVSEGDIDGEYIATFRKVCEWVPDASDWNFLLRIGVELLPGVDLYRCYRRRDCGLEEGVLAAVDIIPAAKILKLRKLDGLICGCLEAGTLVATPDGLQPIEAIEVGDLVLSVDEATGKIAPKPVTDLIRPEPKPLYKLSLQDAGGEAETFHATDDHPWKVEGKGWVETAGLKIGDRIETGSGADMVVISLTQTARIERTYNLTVAEWHTFMVGEDHAVVHNVDCDRLAKQAKKLLNTNRDFRNWFHKSYKGKMNIGDGKGARNPDMGADDIMDAWDEWTHSGRPGR